MMRAALIPDALPPGSWQEIETARTNYAVLDRPGATCRIRLSSIAFRAEHVGPNPPPPGTNGDEQFRAVRMGLLQNAL